MQNVENPEITKENQILHIAWTKEHEEILKEWKAKAFAYLWLQNNSCYFYLKIHNWLAYIIIVLSSISSATMFSISPSSDGTSLTMSGIPLGIIQYVIGSLSLLSAILTGVIRQMKPGEMYQQHASIAKRYHNMIRSIDACLSLTSSLRPNPAMFIERAGTELDTLANSQLEPPLLVIRRFEAIYGPLERVLYGEDVVELWKITYETNKQEQKMRKRLKQTSSNGTDGRPTQMINKQRWNDNFDVNRCLDDDLSSSEVKVVLSPPPNLSPAPQKYGTRNSMDDYGTYLVSNFSNPLKTTVKVPQPASPSLDVNAYKGSEQRKT